MINKLLDFYTNNVGLVVSITVVTIIIVLLGIQMDMPSAIAVGLPAFIIALRNCYVLGWKNKDTAERAIKIVHTIKEKDTVRIRIQEFDGLDERIADSEYVKDNRYVDNYRHVISK